LLETPVRMGNNASFSSAYIVSESPSCFMLFVHWMRLAASLALARAGSNMPARIAMMAMTTSSSMRVNAALRAARLVFRKNFMLLSTGISTGGKRK
jgi:hypothetical protein